MSDHPFNPDPVKPLCTDCDSPEVFHPRPVCQDCGMRHDPDDKAACIEGHGNDPSPLVDRLDQGWLSDDDIQVMIHGTYGQGPMPVEFRDAMAEMVRLVKQGIDDGTLPKRWRTPPEATP